MTWSDDTCMATDPTDWGLHGNLRHNILLQLLRCNAMLRGGVGGSRFSLASCHLITDDTIPFDLPFLTLTTGTLLVLRRGGGCLPPSQNKSDTAVLVCILYTVTSGPHPLLA